MTVSAFLVTGNGGISIDCFPQCGDPCPEACPIPGGACAEIAIVTSFAASFLFNILGTGELGLSLTGGAVGALAALVHTAVHHLFEKHLFSKIGLNQDLIKTVIETVSVIVLVQGILFLASPLIGTAIQVD